MLTYYMDVEPHSRWLRATPTQAIRALPFYCTEAGLFYARKNFSTQRSSKESYLLFYTLSGAGQLCQGDARFELSEDSFFILDCRTAHSYCTAPHEQHWSFYWAHADGAGVRAFFAMQQTAQEPLHPPAAQAQSIKESLKQLLRHARQNCTTDSLEVSLALHSILHTAELSRLTASTAQGKSRKEDIFNAAAYLREHSAQALSIDTVLQQIPVSKYYFIRLFRQYMGTTPYDYLLHYRITCAKELLCTTQLGVGEIARRVGFGNESNFSTQFARLCEQTPLQYRRAFAQDTARAETGGV
ncbi:MAG: AraC family transcriptional regulator [Ruthenibacterium sp.]